jgi:hypothetical protein
MHQSKGHRPTANDVLPEGCTRLVLIPTSRKDQPASATEARGRSKYDYIHGRRITTQAR